MKNWSQPTASAGSHPNIPFCAAPRQNPDVYFQGRETVNPFYTRLPGYRPEGHGRIRQADRTRVSLFDYTGAPDAERVIIIMASGAETAEETVNY